jgi:5-methyltetrahydrofolate--homocysteine methyltransferase
VHTAVKIAPAYRGPVAHVLDASRSVPAVGALVGVGRERFVAEVAAEYEEVRARYAGRARQHALLSIEGARANALASDWSAVPVTRPVALGVQPVEDVRVQQLRPFIDWGPFFIAWELKGKYPEILDDPDKGEQARALLADANALLDEIEANDLFAPRGVLGLFRANAVGDDVEVYDEAGQPLAVFHTLRQQNEKTPGKPNRALADFVAPKASGVEDYLGAFVVSIHGAEAAAARFHAAHDDYRAILTQALADRLVEAFAEWLHLRVRTEVWGYVPDEALTNDDLIRERYRGIRPAPGYPAQPDHTEKETLFRLLDAERNAGVGLTEHLAMTPPATVCGLYLAHPAADYFNVGPLGRDQIEDYARRKGMPVAEVERWLAPVLAYEPGAAAPSVPLPSGDGAAEAVPV